MFYKLGLLIVTRARLVLALGLVALAVSAVLRVVSAPHVTSSAT